MVEDENRRSNDETMNSAVTALQKRLMVRNNKIRMFTHAIIIYNHIYLHAHTVT